MANPDILFRGIPRGPTRGYTEKVVALTKPSKVVVPCIGSFSLAHVAVTAGVKASDVYCGDISLYSTVLANAIAGTEMRVEIKGEQAEPLRKYLVADPIKKAAAVLLMTRVLQYNRKTMRQIHIDHQRELLTYADAYIEQLEKEIVLMRDWLKGLHYAAQDMWVTLDEHRNDPTALLLVNPPRYDGGYDNMFMGVDEVFDWDAPNIPQFREKDYARLMELLAQSKAYSLMYYATQGEDPSALWGEPWRSVFADKPGNKRVAAINWIIANRDPLGTEISRTKLEEGQAKFVMFDDDVKADMTIQALRVEKTVGDYYRDLFIHKLPGSVTETYAVILLGGKLLATVGLHLADLRRGRKMKKGDKTVGKTANITFAFTAPHSRYERLHKLTLMALTSDWFWGDLLSKETWFVLNGAPDYVATTMLTHHPENKTARGVLKLVDRKPQPDGTYKLSYLGAVQKRTREQTVGEWLNRFSRKQKSIDG